jgi:uncharacterized protein (TIGR02996 family)
MARRPRPAQPPASAELLAFLRKVEQQPEDDATRLVLADWLDDHGDPKWAEFIRLRHELAGVVDDAGRRAELVERERRLLAEVAAAGGPLPEALLRAPRVRAVGGGPPLRLVNSIGMTLALIPAGRFLMGKPSPDEGRRPPPDPDDEDPDWDDVDDACPQHEVTLTRPFYLGVYAVTWKEYERVMDEDPDETAREEAGCEDESPRHPAHNLCWGEAVDFCAALSRLPEEKAAGRVYRLPMEAEWEYACRADTTTRFWTGDILTKKQATFDADGPTRVGKYPPNPFGLYDMHGNVLECCADTYGHYRAGPQVDPRGPDDGDFAVFRGGSYDTTMEGCGSAERFADAVSHFDPGLGLRVALDATLPGRARKGRSPRRKQ